MLARTRTAAKLYQTCRQYSHFQPRFARMYATYPPHTVVRMPALSPTMTQGNLGEWAKKLGDPIAPGDVLVAIETDKAQMDYECQDDGFLAKILMPANTADVLVNTPIAVIVEDKESIDKFADFTVNDSKESSPAESAPAPPAVSSTPSAVTESAPSKSSGRVIASPAAKSLAAQKGIELAQITGTGPSGRIVMQDVNSFTPKVAKAAVTPAPAPAAPAPTQAVSAAYKDTPASSLRKIIAKRLTDSKQEIPHYYLTLTLTANRLLKLRQALNSEANGKYKLSVNDFIIKACGLALRDVPQVNSQWHGSFIREFNTADIAVAVSTDTGLITPIVADVQAKGLAQIANRVKELAEKGRQGKLVPSEYQGGTFTISNLGMFGIDHFTAIINPPHAAILAVGAVQDKLVLDESAENTKGFKVDKVISVTLSCDHRVVDGVVGARFLAKVKGYVENPLTMML